MHKIVHFANQIARKGYAQHARQLLTAMIAKKKANDYSELDGNGIVTKELLEAHIGLYEGYVKALNNIVKLLSETKPDSNYSYNEYSELKRRLAVPYNGVFLHELYFEHLKPHESEEDSIPSKRLKMLIKDRWGSQANYERDVLQTGLGVGNGWVVTVFDPSDGSLENIMITAHHIGLLSNTIPIMVLDVWEHAFAKDYLTDRETYINMFLEKLNYKLIDSRLPNNLEE